LSGFIDAEGHLGGRVKYCRTSKLKKAPHLALTIGQKELYILSLIRDLFVKENKCISFDKS
jgi:LAGLIDADG endonuclease